MAVYINRWLWDSCLLYSSLVVTVNPTTTNLTPITTEKDPYPSIHQCIFITWCAPTWKEEGKETILIRQAHNNASINNVTFNIIDPQGGYCRVIVHCISQQNVVPECQLSLQAPWYSQLTERDSECEKIIKI